MKKINLLIVFVLVGIIGFVSSCKNDILNLLPPVVTLETVSQTVMPNTDVHIIGTAYAAGELDEIVVFKDDASYGDAITNFQTDTLHAFDVVIDAADVTETFTVEIQATDKDGKIGKKSVTITVDDVIVKYSGLQIFCATSDQTSATAGTGDYASLTTFETWSHNAAEIGGASTIALIDVCYYNGDYTKDVSGDPHFVSPDACPTIIHLDPTNGHEKLPNANTTSFLVLADASAFSDWAGIDDDTEISAINMTLASANVEFVHNDVIAFELENGKKGVMKAVDGTGGFGNTDYVTVDIIVQKHVPAK